MSRPFTIICMISAFGAGLYLYQSKHQAQVVDREIVRTIKQTEAVRERIRILSTEWTLLNERDRLADLAKAHLSLQTVKPTQFALMADLGSRLPGPQAAQPERLPMDEPEEAVPVAQAAPAAKVRETASAPEPKPRPEAKPVVAEVRPVARPADRPAERATERPTERVALARGEAAEFATPVRARPYQPPAPAMGGNDAATAPGTVGAAVLRAMRAQNPGMAPPAPAPVAFPAPVPRAYAPPPVQPVYSSPVYAAPAPAMSVLGGHPALPPPVPFAAR